MSGATALMGVSLVLFIVNFGVAVFFFIMLPKDIQKGRRLIEFQRQIRLRLDQDIKTKQEQLEKIIRELKNKQLLKKRFGDCARLKRQLDDEKKKNDDMALKLKKKNRRKKIEKIKVTITRENEWKSKFKEKYPHFPKNELERIEIERSIARNLMNNNGGTFHTSQIIQAVESIYPKSIKPNDRVLLLNEIKSWIERDPLCKAIKSDGNISKFTFI